MLNLGTFVHWNCFKQTHCVSYSEKIDSFMLHNLTIDISRHYVLYNLLYSFVVHLVIEEWINHTHCVSYSTNIDSVMLHYFTSEKSDSRCYLINCVNLWYIWSLKSEWIRHTLLAIPRRFIQLCCIISPVNKSDTTC